MADRDSAAALEQTIERYNDAWNAHDLDTIVSLHAPGMVFENHTAGERAEGDEVRDHIAAIFASWPDLAFAGTAALRARRASSSANGPRRPPRPTAAGSRGTAIDVFPFENGLHRPQGRLLGRPPRPDARRISRRPVPRPRIHVTAPVPAEVDEALRRDFETSDSPDGVDGIVSMLTTRVDGAYLDRAGPQLRVVANYAVGVNNVDLAAAAERDVVVANTPDVLTRATAELAVGLMLALLRRIAEGDRFVRRREEWVFSLEFMLGSSLDGKRLLVVGPGRIGRETARWPRHSAPARSSPAVSTTSTRSSPRPTS